MWPLRCSSRSEFGFFRNAIVVAVLARTLCGLVGTFVVLRGMSYMGHGLGHAIYGGAAATALLPGELPGRGGPVGSNIGLAMGRVGRIGGGLQRPMAVIAGFAFGVVAKDIDARAGKGLEALLFGSILGVSAVTWRWSAG